MTVKSFIAVLSKKIKLNYFNRLHMPIKIISDRYLEMEITSVYMPWEENMTLDITIDTTEREI